MRRVVAYLLISLDGVVEAPNEWVFDAFGTELMDHLKDLIASQDDVVLGRVTYQEWASFWPGSTHEPFASFINTTPKHVVSSTLDEVTWTNSTVMTGDPAAEITRLKATPGRDIGVHGSAQLVRSLLRHDLVDELRLALIPVVAGHGRRLFDTDGDRQRLALADGRQTTTGAVLLVYRPRPSE
jgi:dihydrofolate reductase